MIRTILIAVTLIAFLSPTFGEDFYPVEFGVPTVFSSSTSDDPDLGDLWPVSNLLQGPGIGFDVDEPHGGFPAGPDIAWVTNANAGFPADYIEQVSIPAGVFPTIVFDFGADAPLDEISVWAYSSTNSNGVSEFVLRFASDADGPDSFDTANFPTFEFNPKNTFIDGSNNPERQSFEFGGIVNARYVEFTTTDNFFLPPGDGTGGAVDEFYEGYVELPGGDRVGLGEVAFRIPVETPTLDCDFDLNGVCDIVDLDELLYTGLVNGDAKYDLDNSGAVDLGDRDEFLSQIGTVAGDFNLDGKVIAGDLNILGGNWTQAVNSYGDGDANGDRLVNATDLNSLGTNWQFGAAAASAVPEPNGCVLVLGGLLGLLALRRKN